MRLKTLELQGFKSFPDKTKITIDRGMTVVVGPNGSGKSNVSDAIRFVLGEISSKNIRGNKMEDLIFDGTERRRPMGFARVSLTFDNTEGEIPLPLDYDEVTVTRQLFRSGGSEYYINGKPVRLKDIRDLFMNTGLGKSGYSIIGQGRVDEIISEKSEDRRGIFEEAAGIAKYRVRKTEAEKKLAETEDNLSRVSDILSELEGRVEPLQKEAEKARKYLSLYEEKKKADVGLWLYEIDGILSESEKLREDYEIAKHSLEMTDDSLNALSGRNEKLSESLHESRRNEEEAERLLSEHTERLHETESSEKLFLRDIAHLQEEMERLRRERAQKKEEEKKAENALAECEARRREAISCAESVESALHDAEGRLEEKRTALRLLGERLEELRGEAAALGEQILQKQLALSSLEGRDNSDEGRREELTAELAEISRRISATKEALREGEDTAAAYTERADGLRKKEDALLAEEEAIGEKVSACKAAIEKESSAKSGNFSRMEALRRMEEHFEGYANSVRFVMDMAEKGRLRGIRGPVSRLLSVDARYTVAIETALGGNLQNILVEDEAGGEGSHPLPCRAQGGQDDLLSPCRDASRTALRRSCEAIADARLCGHRKRALPLRRA